MSAGAIVALIVAAAVVAAVAYLVRRMLRERAAERERLLRDARDHRTQADASVARARELGGEVERHRAEAERHAAMADEHTRKADEHAEAAAELQQRVSRAGSAAGRHDERASELEGERS
jgi:uncharacterized coiled-coil DUF342 family protein